MKKFYGLVVLFTLALTGCSNDDKSTVYNDTAQESNIQLKNNCLFTAASQSAQATGVIWPNYQPVKFNWAYDLPNSTFTYSSQIQVRRIPRGLPTISQFEEVDIIIDLLNGSTYTYANGFSASFQWRIVYTGSNGTGGTCSGQSSWQTFQY